MRKYKFKVNLDLIVESEGSCPADAWDKAIEEILKLKNSTILRVQKEEEKENDKNELKPENNFIMNRFLRIV